MSSSGNKSGRPPITPEQRLVLQALGANLKSVREDAGLSQEAVADLIGADRQYVADVESGRFNISATRIVELAEALDADATSLFEGILSRN